MTAVDHQSRRESEVGVDEEARKSEVRNRRAMEFALGVGEILSGTGAEADFEIHGES